jgi:L-lactate oxidase
MDVQRRDFLLAGTAIAAAAAAAPALAQTPSAPAAPAAPVGRNTVQASDADIPYEGAKDVRRLKIINTFELEGLAEKILPKGGFDYIQSGSGAEWTKRENLRALESTSLEPHFLSGVLKPDLSTTIFGSKLPFPIIVPPMGSHGRAHISKEVGTAQGVAETGTLMVLSTVSNNSLEEVAEANPGPKWMQLYLPADRGVARELILRAKAAGYTAFVPTIDSTLAYPRETNLRNNFRTPLSLGRGNAPKGEPDLVKAARMMAAKVDLNWDDMLWIKQETGLPVIIKGVMSPVTAMQAVERGIDGVYVSNHGGRALDGCPASITVLPRVADAVKGRVPIVFDSGIRRGQDVFRALALGADVVAAGRPVMYGLALGGHLGVQSVLEYLRDDLYIVMQLAGTPNVKSITRDHIAPPRLV